MSSSQYSFISFSLSKELAERFKRAVSMTKRSQVIRLLIKGYLEGRFQLTNVK